MTVLPEWGSSQCFSVWWLSVVMSLLWNFVSDWESKGPTSRITSIGPTFKLQRHITTQIKVEYPAVPRPPWVLRNTWQRSIICNFRCENLGFQDLPCQAIWESISVESHKNEIIEKPIITAKQFLITTYRWLLLFKITGVSRGCERSSLLHPIGLRLK